MIGFLINSLRFKPSPRFKPWALDGGAITQDSS